MATECILMLKTNRLPGGLLCACGHTCPLTAMLKPPSTTTSFYGWRNARDGAVTERGCSAFSPLPPCGGEEVACTVVAAFRKGKGAGEREARRAAGPETPPFPQTPLFRVRVLRTAGLPHGEGGRERPRCEAHDTRKTWR